MTRPRIRQREQRRFFGRRPGIVPGRRFALVLAFGVLLPAVAASAAAASADDQFVIAKVFSPGGPPSQASVTIGQLVNDPGNCPEYTGLLPEQHGRNTGTSTPGFSDVWALSTILSCLGPVAPTGVTSVTVPNSTGFSQLSPADMGLNGGQSDFANPLEFPVVGNKSTIGSESVQYDRPWRGGNDNNFADEASEPSETPLPIEVFEGPQLNVNAQASPQTVKAGSTVGFSASFTPDSGSAQYNWKFDGGAADSTDATPQVTFTSPGTYDVQVEVIDSGSGSTGVDGVQVTVTSSSSTPPPTPGGGGATGPNTSNGNAPVGVPSNQPSHKPGSSHGHKGGTGNNGGTNGKHHGSTKPSGQTTTPTTTTTTPTQTPAAGGSTGTGGSGTGSAGSSGGPASSGTTGDNAQQRQRNSSPLKSTPPAARPPQQRLVTGQLVSDVKPLPVEQSPLVSVVPAALAAARAAHPPASTSILVPVAAGFAVFALLALGAARELRGRRDWRTLRFGS